MSTTPTIQVTLCTGQDMGDHGERIRIAYDVTPDETVEHLLMRLMRLGEFQPQYQSHLPASDWIEIRYVEGTAPELTAEQIAANNEAPF